MTTDPARSFGQAAGEYDRFRPPYPQTAAQWAIGRPAPARVADLGAGTGILTRVLRDMGYDVVPVEPDAGMRTQLALASPGTTPLAGSAEAIPLADGSVDAAVAGQSYHWFTPDAAHAEIARILTPGATFAAIWNLRDRSAPWVARLDEIIASAGGGDPEPDPRSFGPRFGPVERREFDHEIEMTADDLVGLIRTRSYYLVGSPSARQALESGVRALAAEQGRERFPLPYRTVVYRASTLRS